MHWSTQSQREKHFCDIRSWTNNKEKKSLKLNMQQGQAVFFLWEK